MGRGLVFQCKNCDYKFRSLLGVGFLFPAKYEETIEAAKAGKYGNSVQEFLLKHPNGVLDCDNVLVQCTECGDLETRTDLSMYLPPENVNIEKDVRWSVACPFMGASYVAPWDLKDYKLISHYDHICKKCGSKMRTLKKGDFDEAVGSFHVKETQTEFVCPECKNPLWITGEIMWD